MFSRIFFIQNLHRYRTGNSCVTRNELRVECGDFVCITGNRLRKNALLHILGLLDEPDSGKILIKGQEVSTIILRQIKSEINKSVRIQFHYLIDDLNARENVVLPRLIAGTNKSIAYQKADELLHLMELSDRALHYPNQLSGGEQQRLALARALINNPHIVLADEPTGNLDPQHSAEIWNLFQNLNRELGQTFVIVTHDPELAKLAHKSYELKDGKLF